MASKPLQLEGVYVASKSDDGMLNEWRREKRKLEDEVREIRQQRDDLEISKQRLERSVDNLRKQLSPLHRALRALFGEIELAVGEETVGPSAPGRPQPAADGNDARWESWKGKMPGKPAEMIDLLLLHKSMSTKQLMVSLRCGKDAVYQAAYKLGQAGLVSNANGRYSLKEL